MLDDGLYGRKGNPRGVKEGKVVDALDILIRISFSRGTAKRTSCKVIGRSQIPKISSRFAYVLSFVGIAILMRMRS